MTINVRYIYRLNDKVLKELKTLDLKMFPEDELYDFTRENEHWWIGRHKNKPVCYGGLTVFEKENEAFLCRSGVLPKFRGHGLQKRLIQLREQKAKKIGIDTLVTYVSFDNIYSHNNLSHCGFDRFVPESEWGIEGGIYFYKRI